MSWANQFETWLAADTRFGTSTETSFSSLQQQQSTSQFVRNTIVHRATIHANTRSGYGTVISFEQQTELKTDLCVQNSPAFGTSTTESIGGSQGSSSLLTNNIVLSSNTTELGVRSGFSGSSFNLGGITSTPGQTFGPTTITSNTNSSEQISRELTCSPYRNSQLLRNIKLGSTKQENVWKPTNSAAQKASLAQTGQYKVSNRPTVKIKPKSIHGVLNSGKSQLLAGLEKDDFSSGSDTFVPRESVKKTRENDSSIRSCDLSIAEESSSPNMDNVIDLVTAKKLKVSQEPPIKLQYTCIPSHSNVSENDTIKERPTTLPTPHPAGIVLTRPGYFTVPNLEELAELVDVNGDCYVEDFFIARDCYGSIYFPGVTNVANLNLDEIVHFERKKVDVYPDDDNKPPIGEGLNKKAEITLDCVWPRDKSVGTPIKDAEKLKAMKWQDKLEENSFKNGAEFLDYRPETGSYVFKVKHF